MNGPKFRFTFVVSLVLFAWWAFDMVTNYLLGPRGLNFERYLVGVTTLGLAVLAGFALVWGTVKLISLIKHRTGFEASSVDEYGTQFRVDKKKPFAITLTKFLPQLVANPSWQGLTQLEAEIFGFYNGIRHWPYDLAHPDIRLADYALSLWQNMAALPGANHLHRTLALASCLGKVAALHERRTVAPWSQPFQRDRVSFAKRCPDHGGLAAFVLSTFPAFKQLGDSTSDNTRQRRTLLTALKYRDDPTGVPINADPLVRDLLAALHRAKRDTDTAFFGILPPNTTDAATALTEAWPSVVAEMSLADNHEPETLAAADALRVAPGLILLKAPRMLTILNTLLAPAAREALGIGFDSGLNEDLRTLEHHPALPLLLKHNLITAAWGRTPAVHGLFHTSLDGTPFGPAVLISFDSANTNLPAVIKAAPVWQGLIEHTFVADAAAARLSEQATQLNQQIAAII